MLFQAFLFIPFYFCSHPLLFYLQNYWRSCEKNWKASFTISLHLTDWDLDLPNPSQQRDFMLRCFFIFIFPLLLFLFTFIVKHEMMTWMKSWWWKKYRVVKIFSNWISNKFYAHKKTPADLSFSQQKRKMKKIFKSKLFEQTLRDWTENIPYLCKKMNKKKEKLYKSQDSTPLSVGLSIYYFKRTESFITWELEEFEAEQNITRLGKI
jgi:hypothetical protein